MVLTTYKGEKYLINWPCQSINMQYRVKSTAHQQFAVESEIFHKNALCSNLCEFDERIINVTVRTRPDSIAKSKRKETQKKL